MGRNHRDLDPETRVVMDRSIRAFNINPKRGVRVIIESGFVEDGDDEGLARFLAATVGLNKVKLGEWLGEPDDRNIEVLFNYARTFAFEGVGFERAFRMYLSRFELPGESQKIDRIMEAFAAAFYDKVQSGSQPATGHEPRATNRQLLPASNTASAASEPHDVLVSRCGTRPSV